MGKYDGLKRLALAVGIVIAAVGAVGLAHATLQLYTDAGVQYIAHWTWNDQDTNTAEVDVLLKAAPPPKRPPKEKAPPSSKSCIQNIKVRVKALAEDGTTVENVEYLRLRVGETRKVTLPFDRTLTSLDFIQLLALPGPSCAP